MIITVNCNDDTLNIEDTASNQNLIMPCRHPLELCDILNEIFNRMFPIGFNREADYPELRLINEDNRKVIGEW